MKLESNRRVAACAAGFALPRYAELPTVGLYLDQSVQFVNGCFRTFQGVELTASTTTYTGADALFERWMWKR